MSQSIFTASLIVNPILAFFAGVFFSKWMGHRRRARREREHVTYWHNGGLSR